MMFQPKISIITVTFNSEKTLARTIQSVINQDYKNLEYIIIDGGSTDGTVKIIKTYEKYVSYWSSEPDNGISDAFNKGIRRASGDIIGIINSDDGLCDGALNILAHEYEKDIDVYRGNILLWNIRTGMKVKEIPSMHFPLISINVRVSHQGTFISKMAYKKYGLYNVNYRYAMDYDLLMRFEEMGANMKYIDYVMAFYTLEGLTFTPYNIERVRESNKIIISHGGTMGHVFIYRIVRLIKNIINRTIEKDTILKIKNNINTIIDINR